MGGGGRGMRVVHDAAQLDARLEEAQGEARSAFRRCFRFPGKFLPRARHIEVQILADHHGNLLHLWERDCSVQRVTRKSWRSRRRQSARQRARRVVRAALRIGRKANYRNAGTVEFSFRRGRQQVVLHRSESRIQVEHTVTEMVTGIDLVQAKSASRKVASFMSAAIAPKQEGVRFTARRCNAG